MIASTNNLLSRSITNYETV